MTPEQREYTYHLEDTKLAVLMLAICTSAFGLLGVVFVAQAGAEKRRMNKLARAARSRRLRYLSNEQEVVIGEPVIPPNRPTTSDATYKMGAVTGRFHIFLSHVWSTGQVTRHPVW